MEPVGDAVLVVLQKTERTSEGGIVIPESEAKKYDHKSQLAVFVAAGPLAFLEELKEAEQWKVKPVIPRRGDLLSIASYAGYSLDDPGNVDVKYQVILPRDIQVIVKRNSENGRRSESIRDK